MSVESIFKGILGMGLGTHRILAIRPVGGKLDDSRATHLHPAGCRIQATTYKMQCTSLQATRMHRMQDAVYKDAKNPGCKTQGDA